MPMPHSRSPGAGNAGASKSGDWNTSKSKHFHRNCKPSHRPITAWRAGEAAVHVERPSPDKRRKRSAPFWKQAAAAEVGRYSRMASPIGKMYDPRRFEDWLEDRVLEIVRVRAI